VKTDSLVPASYSSSNIYTDESLEMTAVVDIISISFSGAPVPFFGTVSWYPLHNKSLH
jgi:hypothetical protein